MKKRGIDNFYKWRKEMMNLGIMRREYLPLDKDGDLAELIGVVLGDGHIMKYPRTEELSIFSNSDNKGFIKRYAHLIEKIFDKKPAITKHGATNCTRIRIYQKHIQSRIKVPYSPRRHKRISVPQWILKDTSFIVRYLRGLYEAEGAYCVHLPTSTHKIFFTNRNISMLNNVYKLVKKLGFHPHRSLYQIQLLREVEVESFLELIGFRKY
jgi:hypothetical protein